jgi:hypothetical protein
VTLSEWLDARTPRPPEALAERIRFALGAEVEQQVESCGASGEGGRTHSALLAAARTLLDADRAYADEDRRAARDLLAADALVTYAFELAAEEPARIAALAERAMLDLGRLGAEEQA